MKGGPANLLETREDIIGYYNQAVGRLEEKATSDSARAYGGVVRATKGKVVETISESLVRLAWRVIGGQPGRLSFGRETYSVPVQRRYVANLPAVVRDCVEKNIDACFFRVQVDTRVLVDGRLVMGVECKSYTENAMLKRILVDFYLLKKPHPQLVCCLLQLESQLGGDYSDPEVHPKMGSPRSHALTSHFPEIDLNIITLLGGERNINKPIHKPGYFKELTRESLDRAIGCFSSLLAGRA